VLSFYNDKNKSRMEERFEIIDRYRKRYQPKDEPYSRTNRSNLLCPVVPG
jgi:hypothetical protein